MEPMYLSIQQKETGKQIRKLLTEHGYTVKDVQGVMGFENPQAIYKWISGRSLPSLDNLVILSRLLHTSMEDILVVDGDVVRLWGMFSCKNPDCVNAQPGFFCGYSEHLPQIRGIVITLWIKTPVISDWSDG
jgi:transcriptional regulator with XRE-family HTH domain